MTSSRDAWERVLAAVEADARRTEAMLAAPVEEFTREPETGYGADDDRRGVPAEWLLPISVELPPMESMPPVPEELRERILQLRSQIVALQSELSAAMRDISRQQPRKLVSAATAAEVPAYIDRRL